MFIGKCIILNRITKGKLRCTLVGLYSIIFNRYMTHESYMKSSSDSTFKLIFEGKKTASNIYFS